MTQREPDVVADGPLALALVRIDSLEAANLELLTRIQMLEQDRTIAKAATILVPRKEISHAAHR